MRMWTNITWILGNDPVGQGIIMQGEQNANIPVPAMHWKLDPSGDESNRIWRPVKAKIIERLSPPYPKNLQEKLLKLIAAEKPLKLHPAFESGFDEEAKRLFPGVSNERMLQFREFIIFLKEKFQLEDIISPSAELLPYVDGFGPELLLKLDGEIATLPELPVVYLAPANWNDTSYCVAVGMIGPNVDRKIPAEHSLSFSSGFVPPDKPTEALVYFHAVRTMFAWAAWEDDPTARFANRICELILSGYRPLPAKN